MIGQLNTFRYCPVHPRESTEQAFIICYVYFHLTILLLATTFNKSQTILNSLSSAQLE